MVRHLPAGRVTRAWINPAPTDRHARQTVQLFSLSTLESRSRRKVCGSAARGANTLVPDVIANI